MTPFVRLLALWWWMATLAAVGADEPAWSLVWSDEFNTGTRPDSRKWSFDIGGGGWGNQELQSYTSRRENSRIENGLLILEARAEKFTGTDGITRDYTSARLNTRGKVSWTFGRIEARIKVPRGQGVWPAFWTLGANIDSVGWPSCGEIDIMEHIGREPTLVHGVIHGPGYSGLQGISRVYTLPGGKALADDFHLFAIEWESNRIQWFVDGNRFSEVTPRNIPAGRTWAFNHSHFVLLNLAVGGRWPGAPNSSTPFPLQMQVDYVRVYSRISAPTPRIRMEISRDQVEARWPTTFPQAWLERSAAPNAPWVPWKTDGRRSGNEFVAEVNPGLYRLRWMP